jgi:hypothetical protein
MMNCVFRLRLMHSVELNISEPFEVSIGRVQVVAQFGS